MHYVCNCLYMEIIYSKEIKQWGEYNQLRYTVITRVSQLFGMCNFYRCVGGICSLNQYVIIVSDWYLWELFCLRTKYDRPTNSNRSVSIFQIFHGLINPLRLSKPRSREAGCEVLNALSTMGIQFLYNTSPLHRNDILYIHIIWKRIG